MNPEIKTKLETKFFHLEIILSFESWSLVIKKLLDQRAIN